MESGLATMFYELVRLEIELWEVVDKRLRRDHSLALAWFEPMQVIERTPQCRVLDIAEALSITVGGTSKVVDRIEDAGLCRRRPHPNDGRSSVVSLTAKGARLLSAASVTLADELELQLGPSLTRQQLEQLTTTLRRLRRQRHTEEKIA